MKQRFSPDFDDFYNECLAQLKSRPNYTDAFIPLLERYVTLTATLSKLNLEIVNEEITVEHTNKVKAKNEASSPKWRMFLALNVEANKLADQLGLSPKTAPISEKVKKKGFELGSMKVSKTG